MLKHDNLQRSEQLREIGAQRKYKKVVEERLTEVEKAIRIFSNRKVLVQADG